MQIDPTLVSRLRSSLNEDEAIALLRCFIGTPSVTGAEATFAQLLADELRSLGADQVTLVDFAPGRPNVRGLLCGQQTGGRPCLLIIGHTDTVHVRGWSEHWAGTERENPFSATIVDGAVWGRGAGDLKAGIAATLAAARLLAAAGLMPPADLLFAFVGDEESGEQGTGISAGIKSLIEEIEAGKLPMPDFAVYVEPTRLNIYAAQMGFVICEISVIGRSAYFGVPELGLDALAAAHAVLSAVWAHSAVLERHTPHKLVGRPFVLATGLESGGYIAVPGESRISLILKLLPGESLDDAVQGLEAAVRSAPIDKGIVISFAYPAGRDHRFGGTPTEISPDLGPVRLLGRAVQSVRADRGLIEGAPYWSEAPFLINRLGVPAVYWAPGDIRNCHTLEERVLRRGRSQDNTSQVLVVSPAAEYPRPESLKRLEHAYSLKEDLDPSRSARPIGLVRHWDRIVLVLEDPGGNPLDQFGGFGETRPAGAPAAHALDLGFCLRVGVNFANAIGHLHRRGIVHKDIKPANVLVNSATGRVWLTGFGIASHLPRQRQSPDAPEFLEGTLAYMAPEQTGRMNRSVDSRSDLYSLGITLYEMLTGNLPFTASDPMEWVHCHIARKPVPPTERLKNIPLPVSAIIMKMLAKTAEERYLTAAGVESDLRRCLADWETRGRIDEFPPGEHDTPDRVLIPEKLYGRSREIDTLLASFERVVASGRPELVLVSGYSGIGKSSVVNELHKVLVPTRGLFASGKFDQYKRDIPYATLGQAFQSLIRPFLGKSEAELNDWREALREALGPNGRLMVDLVPELKLIIGEQPPLPDLPPQDAQGRFQLVFQRFIGVFARPEHPLALFLDDLQWLDAATLDLLEDLLTRPDVTHLMLIGAYRDNEVSSAHPLMRKLEAIRNSGATVREIILAPLTEGDVRQLISDSLRCEAEPTASLAQLVYQKTAGNPFFAIQFISALAEEELLTFDHSAMEWCWDLDRIHAKGYTDNVVNLMVEKLNRLSVKTQKALQLFACVGNSAEYVLLETAYEGLGKDLHDNIWEAVRTGLVFRSEGAYWFLHDRVQEAAYSLIPEVARGRAHLQIGRLLASRTELAEIGGRAFEIVNQLNRGSHLITSPDERTQVAGLNLIAGRRARLSTAYASAVEYLTAGRALLTEGDWKHNYELIFGIEYQLAECELLTASTAAAEQRLSMLAERAERVQDIAAVARLRLTLYTTLDRTDRGVEVCLEYLRRGGTDWSPHPTQDQAQREYDRIWSQLGSRSIESIVDLPLMTDPEALAELDVLAEIVTPAEFTDENLLLLVICRMVDLSLGHGNSDGSCFAYIYLGMIAGERFGDYEIGVRFGQLGYDLVEKRGLRRFQARTYLSLGDLVIPWTKHVRTARDLIYRAFDTANRIGDLTFAGYSCFSLNANLLAAGDPLVDTHREAEKGLEFAQRTRFGLVIDTITAQLYLIRTLRGLTLKFGCFNDAHFDELRFERHLANDSRLAFAECRYWIRKLQARFLAADYSSAIQASSNVQRLLWTSRFTLFEGAEYEFYSALSHAAVWNSTTADEQRHHFNAVTAHHKQLGSGPPIVLKTLSPA